MIPRSRESEPTCSQESVSSKGPCRPRCEAAPATESASEPSRARMMNAGADALVRRRHRQGDDQQEREQRQRGDKEVLVTGQHSQLIPSSSPLGQR